MGMGEDVEIAVTGSDGEEWEENQSENEPETTTETEYLAQERQQTELAEQTQRIEISQSDMLMSMQQQIAGIGQLVSAELTAVNNRITELRDHLMPQPSVSETPYSEEAETVIAVVEKPASRRDKRLARKAARNATKSQR